MISIHLTTSRRKTQGGWFLPCARVAAHLLVAFSLAELVAPAHAQTKSLPSGLSPAPPSTTLEPRNAGRRAAIRFLTESDYPPFNYFDEDGQLTGFNVDLAKAICLELAATCDVQVRPWADLINAVKRGEGDAVIASHTASARVLQEVAVTDRYYHTPARFVGLKGAAGLDITPSGLDGRKIAVAKGTAHEAFLRAFFTLSKIQDYENADLARDAVRNRTADLLFDDGIGLVFWLNGEASKLCCEFKGGPFMEPRYFGDGVGILVQKEDTQLRLLLNSALKRLRETGRQEELMLRYFPLRAY
jgi:polar amino acid transport system substrate-binding protein